MPKVYPVQNVERIWLLSKIGGKL